MSGILVPPNHGNGGQHFGVNFLPIMGEAPHAFHNKYEGPNFYLGHPFYTQNKAHNIS